MRRYIIPLDAIAFAMQCNAKPMQCNQYNATGSAIAGRWQLDLKFKIYYSGTTFRGCLRRAQGVPQDKCNGREIYLQKQNGLQVCSFLHKGPLQDFALSEKDIQGF